MRRCFYAFDLKSEIFTGISFPKFQVFAINRTENYCKGTVYIMKRKENLNV